MVVLLFCNVELRLFLTPKVFIGISDGFMECCKNSSNTNTSNIVRFFHCTIFWLGVFFCEITRLCGVRFLFTLQNYFLCKIIRLCGMVKQISPKSFNSCLLYKIFRLCCIFTISYDFVWWCQNLAILVYTITFFGWLSFFFAKSHDFVVCVFFYTTRFFGWLG